MCPSGGAGACAIISFELTVALGGKRQVQPIRLRKRPCHYQVVKEEGRGPTLFLKARMREFEDPVPRVSSKSLAYSLCTARNSQHP